MKRLLILILALFICTPAFAETYKVKRVIDGDTFELSDGKIVQLAGIDAPDTVLPEGVDPALYFPSKQGLEELERWKTDIVSLSRMGEEATEYAEFWLDGKEVRLEFDVQKEDKYGRLLAYVYVRRSTLGKDITLREGVMFLVPDVPEMMEIFVNAKIVEAGYAIPMTVPPNVKYAELFQKLYEEAKEQRRGFWEAQEGDECQTDDECQAIDCSDSAKKYENCIFEVRRCRADGCKCMFRCQMHGNE